ncbi:MAG TPA: class I SAM-dependent methyltransferase [Acidimicrobiia bacterium]|nr:class I SAM-dependent methyltransferase [Acidimicrobiia bacterium]
MAVDGWRLIRQNLPLNRGSTRNTAPMPLDHYRQTNRANWDARVDIHVESDVYGIRRFVDDPEFVGAVVRFDAARLGDVDGRSLLHLQCHIGTDTIGWARLGAEVTGIDISPKSIEAARRISDDTGTPARFIVSELYDAPAALPETFDVVYTGVGAICWLPNIEGWAEVVARFLVPGGRFYMREAHPILWALDIERDDDLLVVDYPYFETAEPQHWSETFTYAGDGEVASPDTYDWNHGMAETLQALIDAGLRIDEIEEYDFLEWEAGPVNQLGDDGRYRLPERRERLALMWSVLATKT